MKRQNICTALLCAALFIATTASADDRTASCSCGLPTPMPTPWVIRHPSSGFQNAASDAFSLWNLYLNNVTQPSSNGTGQLTPEQVLDGTRDIGFFDFQAVEPDTPLTLLGLTPSAPEGAFGTFNQCPAPANAGCGALTDADVLMSAAILNADAWSLDRPEYINDAPTVFYTAVASHEIGHSLGMHHNFHNISIMNYYQDFAQQYLARADVLEARSHFPGRVIQLTDLAAYPFRYDQNQQPQTPNDGSVETSRGEAAISIANAAPIVVPEGPIQIKEWTIENLGTSSVSNARMRFYLSTDRTITSSDYYLGGLVFGTLNTWSDSSIACGSVNNDCTFTVPASIPLGNYYLGGLIVFGDSANPNADAITYNNTWSLPDQIIVASTTASTALKLLDGRFEVSLRAVDPRTGKTGIGLPIPEPGNTLFGYFAIPDLTGNPDNPEVFVKILDAHAIGGNFWVFYGGLTDLQLTLVVKDTQTGSTKQYQRKGGSLCGDADTSTFNFGGQVSALEVPVFAIDAVAATKGSSAGSLRARAPAPMATCGIDALCLLGRRFTVVLGAADPRSGNIGTGVALSKNDLFGYFSIPSLTNNPTNPEVFVKMLDARALNGKFWVFVGSLTDFELLVRVIDNQTGQSKDFHRNGESLCGLADVSAF